MRLEKTIMLRSQEQEPEFQPSPWPVPASETRVTPDELTAAVAALESRRETEARHLQGTLTLGEAVSELHLDATPDELLAEVKAQREKRAAEEAAREAEKAREKRADTGFAVPPSVGHGSVPLARLAPFSFNSRSKRKPWIFVLAILLMGNVFGHLHAPRVRINTSGQAAISAPQYNTLAEVPDGKTVLCSTANLQAIKNGASPAKVRLGEIDDEDMAWRIVKHDGHVYVRLQTPRMSVSELQRIGNLNVYNVKNAGELEGVHEQAVSVPLDKMDWNGTVTTGDGFQQITVSRLGLDAYADLEKM